MITKAVIPVAGLGTRLLPATKEQPKEMFPVFTRDSYGKVCLRPLIQMIFEQLHAVGFREFCFIVGRGKRAIEDHFTADSQYILTLKTCGKYGCARDLEEFYQKTSSSSIYWINQPEPKGFGDAVLKAESFVGKSSFLLHAGDTYIISDSDHILQLIEAHKKLNADAIFMIRNVKDPKCHGIVEVENENDFWKVLKAVEKPEKPVTDLAIMPIYIFKPSIFTSLREILPGKGDEIQLTAGIEKMIEAGRRVNALKLEPNNIRLDIATPESYWESLNLSYTYCSRFQGK